MMKRNYLYAILTVAIWSAMAAIIKMLLKDVPDLEALALSSVFGFLFLLLVNTASGNMKRIKSYRAKEIAGMAGLGFIGLFLYSALYYHGLSILSSQEACILNYLWPVMLVLFSAILLREKLTAMKIAALACSFIGIVILSTGNPAEAARGRTEGVICCIVAAACYGLFSVLNKKADFDQNITMMVIWLTVAICAGITGRMTEVWVVPTGLQWLVILWLGVVVDAVAYLLWALALKGAEDTAGIANLAYLIPFLSLIVSAVVLKERIRMRAVIALVFIIGGIVVQTVVEQSGNCKKNIHG